MSLTIRSILLTVLTLLSSFSLKAQQGKEEEKSLLWKISSKDLKKSSYIFGTIHMICPKDYVWTEAMKNAFAKCQEVCFELDLDDPNMMMEIATGMLNKDGKTLREYFSDSDYVKLERYVRDSIGMDISVFSQMKPVALETMFVTHNNECDNPISYENNLMADAQKVHKEITGLESVSEQLDLFDNLPVDSVIKDVMNTVNGIETGEDDYKKLIAAYKKQDLKALYKLIKASEKIDLDLAGFLDVRNEKWIPRMTEKMDKGAIFFAVGAGHLPGENGVLNLLKKAGYIVTPVK
ncbi:MAG: hypothetical protein BGO70_14610 [Bacteroidetes bacterium 43-93]|mgnify:CR=1 FL=1|nr:TraB/GumN family protein [Bacteroidota bacterium]OJW97026.1 MAG: hypothetical protein BGO70_14610 [Bacteroidetes bacterium 43-93]